jgi:hypothetical protein
MRRLDFVVLLLLAASFVLSSPAWSQDCQYAHVVDPCEKRVVILPVGDDSGAYKVHLDEGPAADYDPRGVALATAPGWEDFYSFVTQGPYLHIVDSAFSDNEGIIDHVRTIDLLMDLGLPRVELTGLSAAEPIQFDGDTVYPLYVVGTLPGPPAWAWYLVFDQEELLNSMTPSDALLHVGPVSMEDGVAVDVAAGAALYGGTEQHAFVSALIDEAGVTTQRFYEITWIDGTGFSVSLDPGNIEGIPFAGSEPASLGLDYDSLGLEAHGVFQTSSVVSDLGDDPSSSCDLVDDPTDVAIWGPDSWGGYVHFSTVSDPGGDGVLLAYAEAVCPYGGDGALVTAVSERPLSVALSSKTSNTIWVYTANGSGWVTALQVSIVPDDVGATITMDDEFSVETLGCPAAVAVRDPAIGACTRGKVGDPKPTPICPTVKYCKLHPTDPLCISTLCAKQPAT